MNANACSGENNGECFSRLVINISLCCCSPTYEDQSLEEEVLSKLHKGQCAVLFHCVCEWYIPCATCMSIPFGFEWIAGPPMNLKLTEFLPFPPLFYNLKK